jgi:hypothetical protein
MKRIGSGHIPRALGVSSGRKVYKPFSRLPKNNKYIGSAKSRNQTAKGSPVRPGTSKARMAPPNRAYLKSHAINVKQGGMSRNAKIGLGIGVGAAAIGAGAYIIHRRSMEKRAIHTHTAVHMKRQQQKAIHASKGRHNRTVRRGPHGHFAGSY